MNKYLLNLGDKTYAPYVHCAANQLNLVLVHAAKNSARTSIKVFFATLQKNYKITFYMEPFF